MDNRFISKENNEDINKSKKHKDNILAKCKI